MFKLKREMKLKLAVMTSSFLITANLKAEIRDPTKPNIANIKTQVNDDTQVFENIVLSAIWKLKKSKWAVINGHYVRQGHTLLETFKVIRIDTHSVTLETNGIVKKLYLLTPPSTAKE